VDYTTYLETLKEEKQLEEIAPDSLYRAFERVKDPRKKRGVRYRLPLILSLIVLGKLAGMKTVAAIAHWVRLRKDDLAEEFHLEDARFPCAATYSNILQEVELQEVTEAIAGCLTKQAATFRCADEPSRLCHQNGKQEKEHVALDGKTLRGTLKHDSPKQTPVHLLALYEVQTGLVLAQEKMQEKENEISAAKDLLIPLYLKGRIFTGDAMHTQKDHCLKIQRSGGAYSLMVKKNHPVMWEDLRLFFEDKEAERGAWKTVKEVEKGHGRICTREMTVTTDLVPLFSKEWPAIAQVFRIVRTTQKKGKTTCEVFYGITSLTPQQASPKKLLKIQRHHWKIENRLHWRRDVTLGEDQSQVRTRQAPSLLAALNCAVLALMDLFHVSNVAAQTRVFDAQPDLAIRLLLGAPTFK
jgi:predicted transposase YbfD/YdcC